MAIQTVGQHLANLGNVEAQTAAQEQATYEKQQTFGTRKAALELDYEQTEYMFHELRANRETRDALNQLNYTKASQLNQVMLEKGPEFVAAQLQVTLDQATTELDIKQLNQKYGVQYAYGKAIEEALSNGNPAVATGLTQQLNNEIVRMTGKPLDFGQVDVSDPNFALTVDHLPAVKSYTKIAKHMSDHGQSIALAEVQTAPQSKYLDLMGKSLNIQQKQMGLTKEEREQAGASLSQLNENLFGNTILGTADEILSSDNSTAQMEAIRDAIANIQKATGATHGEIADIMNDNFTAAQDYDLPGIAWADEVDIILPSPGSQAAQMLQFSPEQFYAQVEEYAKMKDISRQAAADFASRQIIGQFSNMVTAQ